MISYRFVAGAALLGVMVAASSLTAQPELRVTPIVGGTLFLSKPPAEFQIGRGEGADLTIHEGRFRDALTFGVLNGIHLSPVWELEALFAFTPTRLVAEEGLVRGETDARQYMYGASVNYHFPMDLTVGPYLSLGVGGETWDYGIEGAKTHHDLMFQAGGGIDLPLGDYYGLRLDLRDCFSRMRDAEGRHQDTHHLMVVAGVTLRMPSE